jgi:RNA polymerase sigma-70 factor (ECF subfamily)
MTNLEFDNTVKQYIGMLYRIAFNYLKNKEDSEDSVQNVFIRLYNYKKDFKSEDHLKAWLIRVTINESKRILSNNKKHAAIDIEKVANELYDDEIEKRDFSIELMKLNPTYSTVLYLHYYEGYKADEIAKILSKTSVAVNLILSRARKRLKELLQEDYHE